MLISSDIIILILIVFLAFFTNTVTGFGANIIAIALGAHFFPIDFLIPVLIPLNLLISLSIILRHHQHIHIAIFKKRILPFIFLGLIIGVILFNYIAHSILLKVGFGIFIVLYALFELSRIIRKGNINEPKPLSYLASSLWITGSGVIQGIYACGGPFIVIFASRQFIDKQIFRSTIASTFFFMAFFLLINFSFTERLSLSTLNLSLILLPSLLLGFVIGEWVYFRINETLFRTIMLFVLLVSGFFLIF